MQVGRVEPRLCRSDVHDLPPGFGFPGNHASRVRGDLGDVAVLGDDASVGLRRLVVTLQAAVLLAGIFFNVVLSVNWHVDSAFNWEDVGVFGSLRIYCC